jgi:hypothetical protein
MSFTNLGDDYAAAFGADFEAAQIGGGAAQGFVGGVEAVLNAWVGGAVKAVSAKEQMEFAQGLDGAGEKGFNGTGRLTARGAGVVR